MAKMTKSQAKKRLIEADAKIQRVWMESPLGFLTPNEQKTILEVHRKLVSILMKK